MIVAFVGIVIAIALGVVALLRPAAQAAAPTEVAPQYSEQQVAEADKALCDAHHKIFRSVDGAGSQSSDDPILKQIFAVNIRLATHVAAAYLQEELAENPASSLSLATDISELTAAYNDVLMAQLANAPKSELDAIYSRIDVADATLVDKCR
jgi:hypothetical protein